MYYDALTVAAVGDALREHLLEGRVQRVVQSSALTVSLEVYAGQRYQLLLSAEAASPGVYLLETKARRGVQAPSPLQLLLLKYVRGARLEALVEPTLERVMRFTFRGEYGPVHLVCEIMGRYSNIILIDPQGVIMDAIKRIPPSLNRYRTTLPQQPYVPPPAQKKENPRLLTAMQLRLALETQTRGPLWQRLVNAVAAISPLLAREIVFRALGAGEPPEDLSQQDYSRLVRVVEDLANLPQTHAWKPCVAYTGKGDDRRPIAYAPYELTHLPDREPVPSTLMAIARVIEAKQSYDPYRSVRERLHALVAEQRQRQQARIASLQSSLVSPEEIEEVKACANAILAMSWAIEPGQRELVVDAAAVGAPTDRPDQELHISLDTSLTPVENAQRMFQTYHKMKAAAEGGPERIAQGEQELAYLAQLDAEIDLAEDHPQLDDVERAMREAGYLAREAAHRALGKSQPLRLHAPDGTLILVGHNSRQNDQVTFREAGPDDTWLHAHGVPGSHVIIKNSGRPLTEDALLLGARMAAYYSAARGEGQVQVDFTARRHVRRMPGARPGMVTYSHESTLVVSPQVPDSEEGF